MIAFTNALRRAYFVVEALPNELLARGSFPNTGPADRLGPGIGRAQRLWYPDANRHDGCACRRSGRGAVHVSAANGAASSITTACSRTTKPQLKPSIARTS